MACTKSKWGKFLFWSSIWPWRSRSIIPQNNRALNQGLLHLWSKFGDPSLKGWWVIARTNSWLTDTRTHTHMWHPGGHYFNLFSQLTLLVSLLVDIVVGSRWLETILSIQRNGVSDQCGSTFEWYEKPVLPTFSVYVNGLLGYKIHVICTSWS